MTDVANLIATREKEGHDVWIAGGASIEQVATLEPSFGVSLPPSYVAFLRSYGALGLGDSFVSGINNNDALDQTGGSVFGDTVEFRTHDEFRPGLIVIGKHEDGAYCLDTKRRSSEHEYPVVNFEFGSIQHGSPVATTFEDWLIRFFLGGAGSS
jgi:SMI1-KNR4 cell-wall